MTEQEFRAHLKEDKYLVSFTEHTLHRLPAAQYFLSNYTNKVVVSIKEGRPFGLSSNLMTILPPTNDLDRRLINKAYQSIKFAINEQRKK